MGRLSAARREDFVALKQLCYRGLGTRALRVAIGERLAETLRLDAYCAVELEPVTAVPVRAAHRGWPPETPELLARHVLFATPVGDIPRVLRRGEGAVVSEALAGDIADDPYFQHVLLPAGLRHEVQLLCAVRGRAAAAFYLARRSGVGSFAPADLRFLAALAPHVAGAIAAGRMRESAVGGDEVGLVVLDADGAVELADRVGERWLVEGAAGDTSFALRSLHALVRAAADADGREVAELFARAPRSQVLYHLRGERRLGRDGRPRTACILSPARGEQHPSALPHFGLSDRESDVASRVLRGEPTETIAERLGCSPHTVREHLRHVFDKLGVGSRRELALRLMSGAASLAPPPREGMVPGPGAP